MTEISLFKNASSVTPVQVPIHKVFNAIRTGVYKAQIEAIQALPSGSREQDTLKRKLPAVTFGGTFIKRAIHGLLEASGFAVLDFDVSGYVVPPELAQFAYAQFRSPRGGCKVVVRIPLVKDDRQFKEYFYALKEAFPDMDDSGKDISRLCFMSYDPNIIVNEQAPVWTKKKELSSMQARPRPVEHNLQRKAITSNFSKMTIAMGMIRSAPQGSRTDECVKAGRLIGGYIAGGEIMESEIAFFDAFIETNAPEDAKDHIRAFHYGVEKGKELPLKERDKERKAIKAVYNATEHFPVDISFDLDDEVEGTIWDMWKQGRKRGYTTGWDCLDQYYSILLGSTTYVHGPPTSGKSYFVLNLLVNLSKIHGWKHLVFSPESGFHADIFVILIEIYTGKDITSEFGNKISEEELKSSMAFIKEHFVVIDPEIGGADEDLSVDTMMDYVEYLCTKHKFHTVTIDPIVELKSVEDNEREDLFLKNALNVFRRSCKILNLHGFIAVHTRNMGPPIGVDEDGNPYWRPASFYDLAGGQMWSRKGFMILGLWRHKFYGRDMMELPKLKRTVSHNHTLVSIQKVKPKGAGIEGECWLKFDPRLNQFVDPANFSPKTYAPNRSTSESQIESQQEINYEENDPEWLREEDPQGK